MAPEVSCTVLPDNKGTERLRLFGKTYILMYVAPFYPITRGLKAFLQSLHIKSNFFVAPFYPITRGLKGNAVNMVDRFTVLVAPFYPITRGLKENHVVRPHAGISLVAPFYPITRGLKAQILDTPLTLTQPLHRFTR